MESNFEQKFIKEFQNATYRNNPAKTWSDFVEMAACSISNTIDKRHNEEREKRYLEIASGYDKKELDSIANLFAIVTAALEENPDQDFLGSLFMKLELGNNKLGQFFTPYQLSKVAAKMNLNAACDSKIKTPIRIADIACGAGCMLIAFINAFKEAGHSIHYQDAIIFSATDLDKTAALMCYIQTSLLGCAGTVTVGDSLTGEKFSVWYTPMFFSDVWTAERRIEAMRNIISDFPKINMTLNEKKTKTLFDFEPIGEHS